MWKTKLVMILLAALIPSACQPETPYDDEICYRLAIFHTGEGAMTTEQYIDLLSGMGRDAAGERTLYTPIAYDKEFHYGGYCDVVAKWDRVLVPYASVSPVEKAVYDSASYRAGGRTPR